MLRVVVLAGLPQAVHHNSELPGHSHDGSLLGILPSLASELQTPAPQVAVWAKGSKDVLGAANEETTEKDIPGLGDVELGILSARLVPPRHQTEGRPNFPAFREPPWVLKRQHESEGSARPNTLDTPQPLALRVLAGAKVLDLAIVAANLEVQRPDRVEDRGQCGSECLRKGTGCLGGEAAG